MFILKKGHQPGVYVPLRALFLVMTGFRKKPYGLYKSVTRDHAKVWSGCQNS